MKKRNIVAVLAALVIALTLFAACGDNNSDKPEPSTIVGADGQVYEEITEIVTEIVTEIITEIKSEVVEVPKTEAVTDKKGEVVTYPKNGEPVVEVVTNAKGESETVTEVVTEVVTEIVTEVVTEVVTATVPYTEPSTAAEENKDGETSANAETSSGTETSTEIEAELLPGGDVVPGGDSDGLRTEKLFGSTVEKKALYFDCIVATNDSSALQQNVNFRMYMKGDKVAMDTKLGAATFRIAAFDSKTYFIFPEAKAYYAFEGENDFEITEDFNIWSTFGDIDTDTYVETQRSTLDGSTVYIEIFDNNGLKSKYYFNAWDKLVRIETVSPDGSISVVKVNAFSSNVDESVFSIPKGYTLVTEEQIEALMGSLA